MVMYLHGSFMEELYPSKQEYCREGQPAMLSSYGTQKKKFLSTENISVSPANKCKLKEARFGAVRTLGCV